MMTNLNQSIFKIFIVPFMFTSLGLKDAIIEVSLYSEDCQLVQRLDVESLAIPEDKYMIYYPVGSERSQIWILYGIAEIHIEYGQNRFVFRKIDNEFHEVKGSGCYQVT